MTIGARPTTSAIGTHAGRFNPDQNCRLCTIAQIAKPQTRSKTGSMIHHMTVVYRFWE
jgi:hypothetical protein